ncbi:NAD(P)/FAD-dependent oxidoreductase [Nocardioides sp. CFH 31398]|uniref:phytoene desaturase family protein n=1 Tax=Nocardioides sp. CFH 31398 TaxID=2919579 RepID=UPI001F066A9D|nr:NAD(P)/FAD-dependent oxidoreductase [Nocardioides sp. CFH 31398]MCH1868261.1 NAD(P)/FAD-dependent oxidoreductase [Nocardioides sp. CFH 31398]
MARVAVVGAGFGGLAAAARLVRLGHDVVVLDAAAVTGGACSRLEQDGHRWDAGPTYTLLPAVLRDLFRKSGRPLEKELDLVQLEVLREHRFADGTSLALPGGSRGAQVRAADALSPGLGEQWASYVASYTETWELLRTDLLERRWSPDVGRPETARMLASRTSLRRAARRGLRDRRLRLVAAHPYDVDGHDLSGVPAWAGVVAHLEQRFGTWTTPHGMAVVTELLAARLAERGADVRLRTPVTDVVVRGGRAVAVASADGEVDADVVVCAIDPRRLPALAPYVAASQPAMPPVVSHLGLEGELPPLAHHETVLHGDPLLVVRVQPPGSAPDGGAAWTVLARGRGAEDPVRALAERGLHVRPHVVTRLDLSPRASAERWGGSPLGVRWDGRATQRQRLGPRTPVPGVLATGAHAAAGPGLAFVGLASALVAQEVPAV